MKLDLENEKISKLLWRYAIPSIIGGLVFMLYNVVDRIFISRGVGTYALSALSLTFPLFNVLAGITAFISVGATAKIGLKLGENKKEEAEKILGNVFFIFIIISISLTIFGNLFIDKILYFLGANESTFSMAYDYLIILIDGLFFMIFPFGIMGLMQAEGNPKMAMVAAILGALINLCLDPIFIFVFKMGIKGAAIATVLANVIVAIYITYHFLFGKTRYLTLRKENLKIDIKLMVEVMKIGISPFFRKMATSTTILVVNRALISYGGSSSVAVLGIIDTISSIIFMIVMGINEGTQPIISYNYGARNYKRVKEAIFKSLYISTIIGSLSLILVFMFKRDIIGIFSKDLTLIKKCEEVLLIYMMMTPLLGFQTLGVNFFQAIDRSKIAIFLNIFRKVLMLIPLIFIFSNLQM